MKSIYLGFISLFLLNSYSFAAETALEATQRIAGKYTGEWTMFALENGAVVEKVKWTDALVAENPTQDSDGAHVDVTDIMKFSDGSSRVSKFQEGYYAKEDGSVGDRYYEIMGQRISFKKLTDNDWTFQNTPSSWELPSLGFDPKTVISASHVTTKTTTYDGNIDTDHVIRITTIQWRDANGAVRSEQFVSMKGYHTRVPN